MIRLFQVSLVSFLFLVLVFDSVFAQDQFRQGYVKISSDEVKRGYIQQIPNDQFATNFFCHFIEEKDTIEKIIYTPDDILEYGYDDGNRERFVTRRISFDGKEQNVFLKVIEEGEPASLLFGLSKFFISKRGIQFEVPSKSKTIGDDSYIIGVLSDCRGIESLVSVTKIKEGNLQELIRKYNTCFSASNNGVYTSQSARIFSIGLAAGYDKSSISVGEYSGFLSNQSVEDLQAFQAQLNLLITPFKNRTFTLASGAWYDIKQFFFTNQVTNQQSSALNEFRLSYNSIQIPVLIRYNKLLKAKNIAVYPQVGLIVPVSLSSKSTIRTETEIENVITIDEVEVLPAFNEPIGIVAGLGVEFVLFAKTRGYFEANYSTGSKSYLLDTNNVDFTFKSLRLSIGVRF